MSAAPLDSGSFYQKLQDPWPLILRSSFVGEIVGPLFRAIRSSLSLRRNSKKQRKSTHACLAHYDPGYHDEKLQDPWPLLLRPSFSCGRNCKSLVRSNLELLFFDGAFQCCNFSINSSCIFFKDSLNQYILQSCGKDLVVVWLAQTFTLKILMYDKAKEFIFRLQIQQWSSFMSVAPLDSGSFDKELQDPWALLLRRSFFWEKL